MAQKDSTQPKGLPKLSSAVMDFKTTTGKTVGFTFSVFVFKVGASREKDVTDDLSFTYSVPKVVLPHDAQGLAKRSQRPLHCTRSSLEKCKLPPLRPRREVRPRYVAQ